MKNILLIVILLISCNNKNEEEMMKIEVVDSSALHTEIVLNRADSVLEQHDRIKEENLKVLNEVIEKYCALNCDTLK